MSILFDEIDDYYTIADHADLTLPDGDWCVAIWTYVSDYAGSYWQYLLANGVWGATNSFNLLFAEASVGGSAGEWSMTLEDYNGTELTISSSSTPAADSTWRLIVIQRDTTANELQLWFCEGGGSASKEDSTADTNLDYVDGGTWHIGCKSDQNSNQFYGGRAAGFIKGSFALSQDEIEALAAGVSIYALGHEPDVFLPMPTAEATLEDIAGSNDATRYSVPTTAEHCPIAAPTYGWVVHQEGEIEITPLAATAVGRTTYVLVEQSGSLPSTRALSNTYRCTVADATGTILAELAVQLQECVWRLSDVGKARFTIASNDGQATAANLGYGNRIAFEFGNGLPTWGGIIDVPARWTADGLIEITAYSPEYVLGLRRTGKDAAFEATVGTIYRDLINSANSVAATGITIGSIWSGGGTYAERYHADDIRKVIRSRLMDLESCDWSISTVVAGGQIRFTANLYQFRGSVQSGVALIEGHNLVEIEYIEQGPIVNVWYCYGAGSTWDDSRLMATAVDSASVAQYGRREDAIQYSDIETQTQLEAIAAIKVAETATPTITVSGEALNVAPAAFSAYDIGDVVTVFLHSYGYDGYDGQMRLVARGYAPETGRVKLAVESYP